jgi:serine/threonine protein kinase
MTLDTGTKLGRYEIRSKIGAGGMGEVYLARDVEIGREVAVKVLPPAFSTDKDRLQRFQQEACAAGALKHPNILSIYDVGKHDGSPGRWIAHVTDESGTNEVYVRTFPDSGGKWQVSTNGGYQMAWAHNGKELFYVSNDKKMMAVDVKGEGTTFQRGTPRPLFDRRIPSFNTPLAQFAVSSDDSKFIVANPVAENESVPITVVVNWTAGLNQ